MSTPTPGTAAWEFLNGWADRILVLTLARAAERQARVRERLAGVRFELFQGTDKLDLDVAALERDGAVDEGRTPRAYRHSRPMGAGEIACALSHRRIWEETVRRDWSRVVVFEDDVIPRERDVAELPAALAQLPPGWDLCYLGYLRNETLTAWDRAKRATYVALAPLRLVRWTTGEALRLHPKPFAPRLRRAGLHLCTHAYAVSREGARKLAAIQTPISFRADQAISYLVLRGKLAAYAATPGLFDQDGAGSYVGG